MKKYEGKAELLKYFRIHVLAFTAVHSDDHLFQQHDFVEIDHVIFSSHFLPSSDLRRAIVSFWQKNAHKYWLSAQRTKPVHNNIVKNINFVQ